MKRACLILGLFASVAIAAFAAGSLVPVDEASYKTLVASGKGQPVLVNFWATWCVPCRQEMPELAALATRLGPQGVKLIVISADEPEQQAEAFRFVTAKGLPQPAYIKQAKDDQKFIDSIDPKWSGALPAIFLYDRQGRRVASWVGETNLKTVEVSARRALASK